MKMQLFETLRFKFENPNWSKNPEFGLIDTVLEKHPELIVHLQKDVEGSKLSEFGRKDIPSV